MPCKALYNDHLNQMPRDPHTHCSKKNHVRLCMPCNQNLPAMFLNCFYLTFSLFKHVGSKSSPFDCVKGEQTTSQSTSFVILIAEKAQLFSAPIHETSISFVDMVMADIAFDGCVGSYWVLGLQALLLNWRDGYNVTFFVCYLWKVDKNLVSVVKSHMMSHVITTYIPLMHSMMSYQP